MGFVLKPEDLWTRVGMKWDIGSSYVENIVRQQNIRYILESSMGDPTINRAPMWRELLELWRFDTAGEWVNDGGMERQIFLATNQAINTFYGKFVRINPDQDHQVAIRVKTRFLEDDESIFMTEYQHNASKLIEQIQIHQQFLMLQMHQQILQQQIAAHGGPPALPPPNSGGQQPPMSAEMIAASAGQVAQQGGGTIA